ncbi:conserved hypothetical protein [Desulfamplus magnetovallimortis]|uniref:Antitoxin n=1 Tax=Desulfamplus magnetovallimortis TaxID=1246637 RepID=A0A1W1HIB9_9BACT|nr:CopG family antitoxin [Desulfamplus magnetovallimortis]SLM32173.1 conserved hypothetical protein [Desulfamplus magnetovallimortis]
MTRNLKLDRDEQDYLETFEKGEWQSVQDVKAKINEHQQFASNTLRNDKRVNIKISSKVLEEIQVLAAQNGIPYHSFISSVLHSYVAGSLIER